MPLCHSVPVGENYFDEPVARDYDAGTSTEFDPEVIDAAVAYLVFNTIENLTTQHAQVQCFRNAAAHLEQAAGAW